MKWDPPLVGCFKISLYSVQKGHKYTSGGVIRDEFGNCLFALGLFTENNCLLSSECDILLKCLDICCVKGIHSITIESSSRELDSVLRKGISPWRLDQIWKEIQASLLLLNVTPSISKWKTF